MFEQFKNLSKNEKINFYKALSGGTLIISIYGLWAYALGVSDGQKKATKTVLETIYELSKKKD